MLEVFRAISPADQVAFLISISLWVAFEFVNDFSRLKYSSMSGLMALKRREWMLVLADRELRIVDTSVITGLQNSTVFFATTCIFAIGGSFALLSSTDVVLNLYQDLPFSGSETRASFELKVLGLAFIFIYSFFKFAWASRLFSYCSILMGAVQQPDQAEQKERRKQALIAAEMNIIASRHFTAGLRGIFFALAYLGWFIGPYVFITTTLFVLVVVIRRQYFSRARQILLDDNGN